VIKQTLVRLVRPTDGQEAIEEALPDVFSFPPPQTDGDQLHSGCLRPAQVVNE
jgi:hypothetical protein